MQGCLWPWWWWWWLLQGMSKQEAKHACEVSGQGINVESEKREEPNVTPPVNNATKAIRTHGPLYSSSIRPSQRDSLLYTQFSRTHPSSISSSIHSIHCGIHLSLYLNISMCDLVLKDLLRQI
jgi:hypothetical protein